MLAIVVTLSIYAIWWIRSESYQCMNNSYVYGIKLLEKANNAPVTAIYTVNKPNSASVILTKEGFKSIEQQLYSEPIVYPNYSDIILQP